MAAKTGPEYLAAIALLVARRETVTQASIEKALAELKRLAEQAAELERMKGE